ncbi:MAG: FG-GAP repeat domain-containing protein, partial [Planctomycetota bacterium]
VDGNPNVGVAKMTYTSPYGRDAEGEGCFTYKPSIIEFDDYAYTLPNTQGGSLAQAGDNTVGDINADGMPDCAVLGSEPQFAWVLLADTFGDVDINGDGHAPDFAGTYTAFEIVDGPDNFVVTFDHWNRSKSIEVANLDDDDELEILLPGCIYRDNDGPNAARVLIIDMDENGLGDWVEHTPTTDESSDIGSLAVGDFDGDDRDDFAYITHTSKTKRRIVIATSPTDAWDFSESIHELHESAKDMRPGKLSVGDWDGNGTDDLGYGYVHKYLNWGTASTSAYKVVFVKVTDGAIDGQYAVTDLGAKKTEEILAADLDGDGKEDALIVCDGNTRNENIDPEGPGVVIILDVFEDTTDIQIDEFVRTGFAHRVGAVGDYNGDKLPDVALLRPQGKFTIWYGDGQGSLVDSGRSWTVNAVSFDPFIKLIAKGISAADLNGDGLMELFLSDTGYAPRNLVLWLNTSR